MALVCGETHDNGTYLFTVMLVGGKPEYIHIDNYESKKNSVLVKIDDLKKIMGDI